VGKDLGADGWIGGWGVTSISVYLVVPFIVFYDFKTHTTLLFALKYNTEGYKYGGITGSSG
jgi:hypothetical protein